MLNRIHQNRPVPLLQPGHRAHTLGANFPKAAWIIQVKAAVVPAQGGSQPEDSLYFFSQLQCTLRNNILERNTCLDRPPGSPGPRSLHRTNAKCYPDYRTCPITRSIQKVLPKLFRFVDYGTDMPCRQSAWAARRYSRPGQFGSRRPHGHRYRWRRFPSLTHCISIPGTVSPIAYILFIYVVVSSAGIGVLASP